ncbi:MAG: hypothetical protein ACKV2V_09545 [Blastocatellia bacterium]
MTIKRASIIVEARLAEAYNTAPKTRQRKALSAMRQALRTVPGGKPAAPRLSEKETELFLRINRNLPAEQQLRYDELREKREQETLTPTEHDELRQFVAEVETLWADRLQALTELARLRRIPARELMKQLGIESRPHEN